MSHHIPDLTKMINQWTNGTEILNVKPNGDFELGNGVDPLVALGQLAKAFMQQQDHIKRLEEAGDDLYANCDLSRWDSTATAARKLSDQNAWLEAKEAK